MSTATTTYRYGKADAVGQPPGVAKFLRESDGAEVFCIGANGPSMGQAHGGWAEPRTYMLVKFPARMEPIWVTIDLCEI